MSLLGDKLPVWTRPLIYTVGSSVLLLGAAFILDHYISHEIYAALYLFLPLMAVNTIFTYRAGGFSVSNRPAAALMDALGSSMGFGLVICLVSGLRELVISGTVFDIPMGFRFRLPEAALPFTAFILLGFMAALLQWMKTIATRFIHKKEDV
jgi:electron transport complex protein RnfE